MRYLALLVALLFYSAPALATVVTCPSPIVEHDYLTTYETAQGAGVYTVRLQIPDHVAGEYTVCHVLTNSSSLGAVQFDYPNPIPLECHQEDVSAHEGLGNIDAWCESATEVGLSNVTVAQFRILVEAPLLLARQFLESVNRWLDSL